NRHDPRAVDLGNAAIIPGLVNAHTHLEFSDLAAPLKPAEPFTDWVRAVVAHRRGRTLHASDIVHRGLQECARTGTTALAEIVTAENSLASVGICGPLVIAQREIIGLLPAQVDGQFEVAKRFLDGETVGIDRRLRRAISPHAPYSVHPELFTRL